MSSKKAVIAAGIVLTAACIAGLTAMALWVSVRAALWGVVAFFVALFVIRILARDYTWLRARSTLFDALFLASIIAGLALTISAATTPSPV